MGQFSMECPPPPAAAVVAVVVVVKLFLLSNFDYPKFGTSSRSDQLESMLNNFWRKSRFTQN